MVAGAGFREVRVRAEVKMTRFRSAEHMVRSLVGGAPTMLAALAEQGVGGLVLGVAEAASAWTFGGPYREVVGLLLFFGVLIARPQGLFGRG